jgi:flagellar basal body P-ring protein FlgI
MQKILLLLVLVFATGCSTVERLRDQKRATRSDSRYIGEVPNMLKGTVKHHVALMGFDSTYSDKVKPSVSAGYGLVIGLQGTGSSEIPPQVRAHMIADLARRGVGQSTQGYGKLTPKQLINSEDTAVVIVEAIIPQAATGRKPTRSNVNPDHHSLRGTTFDVHVFAEPSSSTSSLEGGFLLPTYLRLGQLTTGKGQAREVAVASGPLFINPFADPEALDNDYVDRTSGRVLDGGEVMINMPMRLVLLDPSHARASNIQTAINRVFPEELGQDGPTARGINDEQIEIRVPPSWKDDVATFVEILTHITLRVQNPETIALQIKRMLVRDPSPRNADAAIWRWRALGDRALPIIRQLYEYPDEIPRLAALRAGGGLKDPISVPHLIEMANADIGLASRLDALDILEGMPRDFRIEVGLRPLLNVSDLEIRLKATETLVKRDDPTVDKYTVQDKFDLIVVESDYNTIYVTQTGIPRIILSGDISIERPLTMQTWGSDLVIKESTTNANAVEVRHRNKDGKSSIHDNISPSLPTFTMFLAHKSTPEAPVPGLDLTYSRIISAIHSLWRQQYLNADFKVEQDRLLAAIKRLTSETTYTQRPEFGEEEEDIDKAPRFIEGPPVVQPETEEQKPITISP